MRCRPIRNLQVLIMIRFATDLTRTNSLLKTRLRWNVEWAPNAEWAPSIARISIVILRHNFKTKIRPPPSHQPYLLNRVRRRSDAVAFFFDDDGASARHENGIHLVTQPAYDNNDRIERIVLKENV